ncbi:MAG: hypothetical protein QM756_05760 [Polyangiaceae bacterium]
MRGILLLGLAVLASAHDANAEPWSSAGVGTVPSGRWEVGLFQNAHYGVSRRVELSLHPLLTFVLPHLELKALAFEQGPLRLGVRGRWSYPTGFLAMVSREGSGGLLPKTSKPPFAIQIEGDAGASFRFAQEHELSGWLGLAVAPHADFTPEQLPLLDFPFLYPRFAPLYSPLVPRAQVALEGRLLARCFYQVGLSAYLMPELPDVGTAFALENLLALEYRASNHFAASLGLRSSYAEYAIGTRLHTLPFFDVRVGF